MSDSGLIVTSERVTLADLASFAAFLDGQSVVQRHTEYVITDADATLSQVVCMLPCSIAAPCGPKRLCGIPPPPTVPDCQWTAVRFERDEAVNASSRAVN
jgi:hypothetical protein